MRRDKKRWQPPSPAAANATPDSRKTNAFAGDVERHLDLNRILPDRLIDGAIA